MFTTTLVQQYKKLTPGVLYLVNWGSCVRDIMQEYQEIEARDLAANGRSLEACRRCGAPIAGGVCVCAICFYLGWMCPASEIFKLGGVEMG